MIDDGDDLLEIYCGDCGCVADDEVCPRCVAEAVDMRRRLGLYQGDRRWNGESMTRTRGLVIDGSILKDVREKPNGASRRSNGRT